MFIRGWSWRDSRENWEKEWNDSDAGSGDAQKLGRVDRVCLSAYRVIFDDNCIHPEWAEIVLRKLVCKF